MIRDTMKVAVIVERRESDSPWATHEWRGVAVLPGAPDVPPWHVVERGERWVRYHAGHLEIEIFGKETEGYRLNLVNRPPKVFVVFRESDSSEHGIAPFLATVCPYEAEGYLDGEGSWVEAIPMPALVEAWLARFTDEHHVEQPFIKRQRTPHDSRRGGPIGDPRPGRQDDGAR